MLHLFLPNENQTSRCQVILTTKCQKVYMCQRNIYPWMLKRHQIKKEKPTKKKKPMF